MLNVAKISKKNKVSSFDISGKVNASDDILKISKKYLTRVFEYLKIRGHRRSYKKNDLEIL